MAEPLKFQSKEVKSWLERETSQTFVPVHTKAQKMLDEMRRSLESLTDASRMLLDNSNKEIEKRNMKTYGRARALNKLARLFLDRIRQAKVPDKTYYDTFQEFVQETQKTFFVFEVDIKNWFPRISPFFILDRRKFLALFEKAKDQLKELNDFVTREYVKTKTLEETFQLIDRLHTLEEQLTSLSESRKKVQQEKALVEKETADTRQKMTELKSTGGIGQLNQLDQETATLGAEVKQVLQHLQKPFIKFQSLALHGGGTGLAPDELKKLGQYLENPFEALATEENGCPALKGILHKLSRALVEGKLKLKPEKTRKAEQAIDRILNQDSMVSLRQRCVETLARKRQLSSSEELEGTMSSLSRLEERYEETERRRKRVESDEHTLERTCEETQGKIRNSKELIEKNVLSFLGRRIRIE